MEMVCRRAKEGVKVKVKVDKFIGRPVTIDNNMLS